ncbi:hypothetical protein CGU37_22330 [Pseudomonas fluorescens]|nr:hypothetical protein CGU36_23370 [Pseudomonas fluorescens]OZO46836.1 hypothetical protein CGU37_22330 [Pseudomonas fluorescens]TGY15865.1 RES domain-containing protein [Pseudomonas fluorescens]
MTVEMEAVCFGCVGDRYLQARIKKTGVSVECSICGKKRKSIDLEVLVDEISRILEQNIKVGEEERIWDQDRDRVSHYEQKGDTLDFYIGEVLQLDNVAPLVERVQDKLLSIFPEDAGFFDSELFQRKKLAPLSAERSWNEFRTGVMHKSRFFNLEAKTFLRWLFKGLEDFKAIGKHKNEVIRVLDPSDNHIIFRARDCTLPKDRSDVLSDPINQLGTPPKEFASDGRMSPRGVPVFYGALGTRETCIAELRPPAGGVVISGEFKLTKFVRVLDFKALEDAYEQKALSFFDPEYRRKIERRQFLKGFHSIISQPVVPKQEHEYLQTQVIAEYLATQHFPRIDGVIFSSAQHEGGLNLVLFSHVLSTEPLPPVEDEHGFYPMEEVYATPSIEFVPESLLVHYIKPSKYSWSDTRVIDGQLETDIDDYYEWDY